MSGVPPCPLGRFRKPYLLKVLLLASKSTLGTKPSTHGSLEDSGYLNGSNDIIMLYISIVTHNTVAFGSITDYVMTVQLDPIAQ